MNNKNIENIIYNLRKKIISLEYRYFILNKIKISDYEYDLLLKKLKYLEDKYPEYKTKNSPTIKINNFILNLRDNIKHFNIMLSLKTIYSFEEYNKFINKINNKLNLINKIEYCCEYKLDGLAANLIYKKGILISISTRGNGLYGESIYHNIDNINGIPKKLNKKFLLPNLVEIRGEICISNKEFFNFNKKLKLKNKKTFSNSRNAASGLARQKKNNSIKNNILNFFCYGLGKITNKNSIFNNNSQFEILNILNNLGFNYKNKYKKFNNIDSIYKYYLNLKKNRHKLKYSIDGLVVKIDSINLQNKLGLSSKFPNWAVAYKFPSEEAVTYVKNIYFDITKTGTLIPIAEINEVIISGVLIKKIYLNNINKMIKLNINIGDKILIKRSGDVIPTIKNVIEKKNNKIINIPENCPSCNSKIENINNILKCSYSFFCKSQINNKINHFFSKDCNFAKGLGKKTINIINKYIKINSPIDLYNLNINNLLLIPNIKFKKANNILNSLEISKNTTLYKFIYSLGINNIGKKTSIKLSLKYNNILKLIKEYKNDYINNKLNINKNEFNSLNNFMNNKINIDLIYKLTNYLNIKNN
ncbi:NAD-dependent DNA ligase LigA [endosymbiont of Pachyrhynchus infernalis]|uniref:NAD-dependent DNA ligase LigA n=1 Tax=endosymbiont of Pachyrhynchus infernalis TaxID=1971488 RepID=UPI000DC720D0|nr:NAD-dependent DNA ligase LigA [endosymbiont of Pachyrhynchus infernalis]BBA84900.1 DNA ligase [endosymbiont of Pachyrhynchus infernalis]